MLNAMDLYTLGNKLYKKHIPFIPKVTYLLNYLLFHSVVPYQCTIGKGSRFAYGGMCVVINKYAVIGEHCLIGQGITIGGKNGPNGGVPKIGDRCYLAAGCRILGGITIGNNCVVGANAVVTRDVPDNCVVGGVPARIIKENIDIHEYWKD